MATKTWTAIRNTDTTLVLNTFERVGYNVSGWNKVSTSSDVEYQDGATIVGGFSNDVDLYAIWRPNTYTLHRSNGYGGTVSDISSVFDTSFLVDAMSRTGYKFKGWYVTSGLNSSTAK